MSLNTPNFEGSFHVNYEKFLKGSLEQLDNLLSLDTIPEENLNNILGSSQEMRTRYTELLSILQVADE